MGITKLFDLCRYALECVALRVLPQRARGRCVVAVDASGWLHKAGK